MLNPTPREQMLDCQGRPYFLWDCDLDVQQVEQCLEQPAWWPRGLARKVF